MFGWPTFGWPAAGDVMPTASAYAIVFAAAFGVTLVLTPIAGWVGRRLGALAQPDERRVHQVPTPYFGGLAMFAGFAIAMGVAWRMDAFGQMFDGSSAPLGVLIGAAIACAVGTTDDVRPVSPPAKTAGLVLAGSGLYLFGAAMVLFRFPFAGTIVLGSDLAPLVTVLWVVGMANAVNLIDGLDGLAAGIVAIAGGAFFLYGHRLAEEGVLRPENPSPLLAVIVFGICLGFLPFNFHPARIFMGDGGALMLGVIMAGATMLVGGQTFDGFSGQVFFFYLPFIIPIVVMGVPIIDTAFAILRRARNRSGVSEADKDHLHHRLMRLGHGQRRSVLILWTWTALLSAFVLYPVYTSKGDAAVPIGIAALGLVLYTYFHPGIRRARGAEG
ncbi:MAG: undecaprenyl/decaprenyl-phosphate alpha-N-acetylglucosaminyl 1-phosphate transferase [Acidimicrobiia bacterium]|nr:undecaprenyl/decaprenyl-phosphate alpha-N-acetylglucosaminyl 1-phosphate transferase [Acidimicrobiia bacterium]